MLGALLYLRFFTVWNRIFSRLRRLRQPKYLMGALVGGAYIYFFYLRKMMAAHHQFTMSEIAAWDVAPNDVWKISSSVGALILLILAFGMWLLPSSNPGLSFTEAETAFLFPAPVTRRALIHFKIASAQLGVFVQSLLFALIFNARGIGNGRAAMILVGWWIILTTINLHYTAASLSVAKLVERGISVGRRRAVVAGVVMFCFAATLLLAKHGWRPMGPADEKDLTSISHYLAENLDQGALHYLLIPFGWVVRPFLAPDLPAFYRALPPALLLIILHYVWVSGLEVAFEEDSLARSQKRAAFVTARLSGNFAPVLRTRKARRAPFTLGGTGRPEIALLWKNLLTMPSLLSPRVLFWFLLLAGISLLAHGILALVVVVIALLFGPILVRNDLRSDLPQAEILKTYPLHGWQIALGETLTPIVLLTSAIWLALSCGFAVAPWNRAEWITLPLCFAFYLGLTCCLPFLVAVLLLVPNAAALTFPAWFEASKGRGGGIDVMGQRIIFLAGQWVVIVMALIPAILAAGGIFFILQWVTGSLFALMVTGGVTVAILASEAALGFWWLGHQFEKIDIATELRP